MYAALTAFAYVVLAGGTAAGELLPVLRIFNGAVAAALILGLIVEVHTSDRTDRLIVFGVLAFAVAGVLSQFPRQSFDAVLAALTWAAGLFVARRILAGEAARNRFIMVVIGLSATLTVVTAARWLPVVQAWWHASGSPLPPLDLNYPAVPWGHWHDLALLLALLYPAWWVGRSSPLRRSAAVVIGLLDLCLVLVDGSRNNWAAIGVATAVALGPAAIRWARRDHRVPVRIVALAGAAAVVGAALLVRPIFAHALDLTNLGYRGAMWGSLIDAWTSHPVSGFGPGSFPWILQQTSYFNTHSLAPRHPDSAFFQLLGEGGLLGILAAGLVLAAVVPAVLRGRSQAATWSVTGFAMATLAANPTDFAFLIVIALGWVAFAAPVDRTRGPSAAPARRPAAIRVLCLAGIAAAYAMTMGAALAYSGARQSIETGNLRSAIEPLDTAIALDPGMALYVRQRGTVEYLLGNLSAAARDLTEATVINPSDDLAFRSLALAEEGAGRPALAKDAIERAVALQRSDPTNLLLLAHWDATHGRLQAATGILAEVVEAWPEITAAPGWNAILPSSASTASIIDAAITRWQSGKVGPEPFSGQGVWLALLGGRRDLLTPALRDSSTSGELAAATLSVFQCDPSAERDLAAVTSADRRQFLYWLLRLRESALTGTPAAEASSVVAAWGGDVVPADALGQLNPLDENGTAGFSADAWGYRRSPVHWQVFPGSALPSPWAGAAKWLMNPAGAVRVAGVQSQLPLCR